VNDSTPPLTGYSVTLTQQLSQSLTVVVYARSEDEAEEIAAGNARYGLYPLAMWVPDDFLDEPEADPSNTHTTAEPATPLVTSDPDLRSRRINF
jgi:hypothetical protein